MPTFKTIIDIRTSLFLVKVFFFSVLKSSFVRVSFFVFRVSFKLLMIAAQKNVINELNKIKAKFAIPL